MLSQIFITNIFCLYIILLIVTLVGGTISRLMPNPLQNSASYFLSPCLGLAFLCLISTVLGRYFIARYSILMPMSLLITLLASIIFNKNFKGNFKHANIISVFGLICSFPFLLMLYQIGGYNTTNDTFTYLAQSDWLQLHSFSNNISLHNITPSSTQIALYQSHGLRMGATYFLSYLQSIFHLEWSYTIYPTVVLVALVSCCVAMGFLISYLLPKLSKHKVLLTLIIPGYSLSGLTFGSQYGFLPQTFGLTFAASYLFLLGPYLKYIKDYKVSFRDICQYAIPSCLMFSMGVICYFELAPVLLLTTFISYCCLLVFSQRRLQIILSFTCNFILWLVFINEELPRAIKSILLQSNAVVGTPVDWPLYGFIFHIFGLHGGAWSLYQWSTNLSSLISWGIYTGLLMFFLMALYVLFKNRRLIVETFVEFLPSNIYLFSLCLGIIYYRYFHDNPFELGKGQSWNQFKLSEWACPIALFYALLAVNFLAKRYEKYKIILLGVLMLGFLQYKFTTLTSQNLKVFYNAPLPMEKFYLSVRDEVLNGVCKNTNVIYLNLLENDIKLKQMLALFLYDKDVQSNWLSDGYIVHYLDNQKKVSSPMSGECIIQRSEKNQRPTSAARKIGFLEVFKSNCDDEITKLTVTSDYNEEFNNLDSWYWVNKKIQFKINNLLKSQTKTKIEVSFSYGSVGNGNIIITLKNKNELIDTIKLSVKKNQESQFKKIINHSPYDITDVILESDVVPQTLGQNDSRVVSFRLINFQLKGSA